MLPDPTIEPFFLGPFFLHPFGVLVGIGTVSAYFMAEKCFKDWGLRADLAMGVLVTCFVGAAIGGHTFDLFLYTPERLTEESIWSLLNPFDGLASIGAFIGAVLFGAIYVRRKKQPIWPYVDGGVLAITLAWVIGRIGCTIVWDHPGGLTDFFLGMEYKGSLLPHGVRHNLGFYEALFAGALFAFYMVYYERTHFVGWVTIVFGLSYMPTRFAMDFLRAGELRYLGLTASQYLCVVAFVYCIALYRVRRQSTHLLVPDGHPHIMENGEPVPGVPPPQSASEPDGATDDAA